MDKSVTPIISQLEYLASTYPSKNIFTFLKDGETVQDTLTYHELITKSQELAAILQEQKLTGERALLLFPQGLDYIIALFGCLYAGVIAVPLYPPSRNRKDKILKVKEDCSASILLSNQTIYSKTHRFAPELLDENWILIDKHQAQQEYQPLHISLEDIAYLQYTSGSTGDPKGVVITHKNVVANTAIIEAALDQREDECCVCWLPFFHDMGITIGIMLPIHCDYPTVLMDPADFVQKPFRWLKAISDYKATRAGAPNFAFDLCVDKISDEEIAQLNLSNVHHLYNGGETVSDQTQTRFLKRFESTGLQDFVFYPCYGMAEATLLLTGGSPTTPPSVLYLDKTAFEKHHVEVLEQQSNSEAIRVVSCGKPQLGSKIKIVEPENGKLLLENRIGEIWAKGENISAAYWENPEVSAKTFNQSISALSENGYYRTGDLGFLHNEELYITGRIKDVIIVHGRNLYAQDLERAVQHAHTDIVAGGSAAFSIIVDGIEKVVLLQEIKRTALKTVNPEDVVKALQAQISAEFEISLYAIVLLNPLSIPKTTSGKVMRKKCKTDFLSSSLHEIYSWRASNQMVSQSNGQTESINQVESVQDVQQVLTAILAKQLQLDSSTINPEDSVFQLGITSIIAVDVIQELKKIIQADLDPSLFWEFETIENIANFIYSKEQV